MPSENQRRHSEVQEYLDASDGAARQSPLRKYWSGSATLEREHAREEAAIDTRLARMKSRPNPFPTLQTQ